MPTETTGPVLAGSDFDRLKGDLITEVEPRTAAEKRRATMADAMDAAKKAAAPAVELTPGKLGDEMAERFDFDTAFEEAKPEGTQSAATPPPVGGSVNVDTEGATFDPGKHEANEDGTPRKNKDGSFRKKWTRRAGEEDEYDAFAGIMVETTIGVMAVTFDAEEAIPSPERKTALKDAWATYARIKQLSIADPLYALVAQNLLYVQSVVSKPKSKEKALGWARSAVGWFRNRFSSKSKS
jgi:hypothetical protein